MKHLDSSERARLRAARDRTKGEIQWWAARLSQAREALETVRTAFDKYEREKDQEIQLLKRQVERVQDAAHQKEFDEIRKSYVPWNSDQPEEGQVADDQSTREESP